MNKFINQSQLQRWQLDQSIDAITKAFPRVIGESHIIKQFWKKLEIYFPEFQLYLFSEQGDLIGFINMIPFHFNKPFVDLPDSGWDWMLTKGVLDFENNITPNYLGGLQVIIRKQYLGKGFSSKILKHAKHIQKESKLYNIVIPIRPTKKHEFPNMSMESYMNLKKDNKVYDPWIRTHIKNGARIIQVCNQSMTIRGDVKFWETLMNKKITQSGKYLLSGALQEISIDLENNTGAYIEPNIWIVYD